MNRYYLFLCVALLFNSLQAQEKKFLDLKKTINPPKVDAILDDQVWQEAGKATDFVQFRPAMGIDEIDGERTVVQVSYDDNAVYFAAYIHDKPENIMSQFTTRDNFGQADFFLISINPNNDGQNDSEFLVFSTGTQGDALVTSDGNEDWGWNAVWDSAVKIVDDGWIVEIKIPYSALRFSNKGVQTWGINFHRRHMRDNRQYTWNPIDISNGKKIGQMHGEIRGIENISPPTRLAFFPFTSAITRSYDGENDSDFSFGMDVKYGITENFTLDATLVPDFSQAGFDNVQLNLGPFEQQFSEQRQFFTEGVDLFNKGNLFYSRRIGNSPTAYPILSPNEVVTNSPNSVKVLNALKLSGRTKDGLGVAFFNAITEKTEATIEDNLTQNTRKEIVEPLANYNILVVDKQFNGNSSISLVNTNV
ncbi:MAG: protein with DOMON-like ligand-binding domain protein, partial [Bacteroidetes bacterium]